MRALYIQLREGVETKYLIFLIAPIPEAIFLFIDDRLICHCRFSSINTPSDFTEVTSSSGTFSMCLSVSIVYAIALVAVTVSTHLYMSFVTISPVQSNG